MAHSARDDARLDGADPLAQALVAAIRGGDLATLERLLADHPGLARVRIVGPRGGQRTALHVVADWPGFFPNGPAVVRVLVAAGGDPDAPMVDGNSAETPLHWAASSDDVDVARALIDGGANIEATGASIAGGTPLDDAVGYGCWQVARLLVARGARVARLWHAAALGVLPLVEDFLDADPPPTREQVNEAFWQACHGGQRRAAEYLFNRGADPTWIPPYNGLSPLEVTAHPDTSRQSLVDWLKTVTSVST